jgi:hypothetical protein
MVRMYTPYRLDVHSVLVQRSRTYSSAPYTYTVAVYSCPPEHSTAAFGRSHSLPSACPTLLSPEAPPASGPRLLARKKGRGMGNERRGLNQGDFPLLSSLLSPSPLSSSAPSFSRSSLCLSPCLISPSAQLVWPQGLFFLSFSQRRSGGAGPPFAAAAGRPLPLVRLRVLTTRTRTVCRYTTKVRVPQSESLATRMPRGSCSRRYEHAEQSAFYIESGSRVDLLPLATLEMRGTAMASQ